MSSDTLRCCAHILNLILWGWGLKELDTSITKEREVVRYVKSSPNRNKTFKSFMNKLVLIPSQNLLKILKKCSHKWTLRMQVIRHTFRTRKKVMV